MIAHFLFHKTLFWKLFRKLHGGVDTFKSLKLGDQADLKKQVGTGVPGLLSAQEARSDVVGVDLQGSE